MAQNPTYKELEQKVEEFEKGLLECKRTIKDLNIERQQIKSIFDSIDEPIYVADPDTHELLFINKASKEIFGNVIGQKCHRALQNLESPCSFCTNERIFGESAGQPYIWEFQNRTTGRTFHCIDKAIRWPDGRRVRYEMAIDITDRIQAEEELRESKNKLSQQAKELKQQAEHLEEVNTALKVLLNRREEEREELEENILINVEKLILPYIEKMEKGRLKREYKTCLNIIKSNLKELISPFGRKLSAKHLALTPTEMRIADLVKLGETTKDIAGLLNVSSGAIEFHRNNIRKKFGLKNKKINLRSYLLSLP